MTTIRILPFLMLSILLLSFVHAQRLPEGSYQTNRERSFDLIHLKAAIDIDWDDKEILGAATLRFSPLTTLSSVTFDAIDFEVIDVRDGTTQGPLKHTVTDRSISIDLPQETTPADTVEIIIGYVARPTAGLYFVDPGPGTNEKPAIFTYGEGGIHANWLPLYNAPNDKFSNEMMITVAEPLVAISNGRHVSTTENDDGTRTYHWHQELPHSDYLLGLFVGDYRGVELRPAFGEIPLTVWVHPGQEDVAAEVFSRTSDMVEWFSERFDFRYPWEKYDQIVAFDYAIGAMENTSITGHNDRILRSGPLQEFNPDPHRFTESFTAEAIISHELAHHWFGNVTTYRNLSHLWLNESFASYLMMLWDEHRLGEQELRAQTSVALSDYLDYVATDHIIRPLEWQYFDTRGQIYNIQTTYQKGAIVLNQLRWVLGDEAFFRGLSYFIRKHQYANVMSHDLLIAFEESTGKNLEFYFNDWVWGGGHPVLKVSSAYIEDKGVVELSIEQVQPHVKGQDLFTLPVDIRIDAGDMTTHQRVWIKNRTDHFVFNVDTSPDMVSVDGKGYLVADIHFPKSIQDLQYQVMHDDLPGQVRAVRQLIDRYASHPAVVKTLRTLMQSPAHWYVKADAALRLGSIPSPASELFLIELTASSDYHVRKAATVALGAYHSAEARTTLRGIIKNDSVDEIAAAGIVALSRIDPSLSLEFYERQLETSSWYGVRTLAALTAMESKAKPEFAPLVKPFTSTSYNYAIRSQALRTWAACTPLDEELRTDVLPSVARNDILDVRITAMELLAGLKVEQALPILEELAKTNGDMDIRAAAQSAIEDINRD